MVFFVLGFLVYAFLYAAIGSTVSKLEDANILVLTITFLFIILWYNVDTLTEFKASCAVKMGAVGRENVARFLRSPFVDSDRIITVVYHRIAVGYSNSATGVEIVKKERFRRGFYCCTIFHIKSTKN